MARPTTLGHEWDRGENARKEENIVVADEGRQLSFYWSRYYIYLTVKRRQMPFFVVAGIRFFRFAIAPKPPSFRRSSCTVIKELVAKRTILVHVHHH